MKIIWVSDNPRFVHVGQSRVSREFCSRLCKDFELIVIGINEVPDQLAIKENLPYCIDTVTRTTKGIDKDKILAILLTHNPDIIILSHDVFLFPFLSDVKKILPKTKIIGYFTIDGDSIPKSWIRQTLMYCDVIITPSEFGREVLFNTLITKPLEVVGYGINKLFSPGDKTKNEYKKEIADVSYNTNILLDVADKFCALYYGMNQTKKGLDVIRKAWIDFSADKDDVFCLMMVHSHSYNHHGYIDVGDYDVMRFQNIKDLIFLNTVVPDDNLVKILRAFDVLLFPSIGEGFNLPCLEAMACGCIPITTHYAASTDYITSKNSFPLTKYILVSGEFNVNRAAVDYIELIEKLNDAYSLWKSGSGELLTKRNLGFKMVKNYDWDLAYTKMKNIITDLFSDKYNLVDYLKIV